MSESTVRCQKCRRPPDDPEHLRNCDCDCSQPSATTVVSRVVRLRVQAPTTDGVVDALADLVEDMRRGDRRRGKGAGRNTTSTFYFQWEDVPSD